MVRVSSQERIDKYDKKRQKTMPVGYETMVKDRKPDLEALGKRAEVDSKVGGILTQHGIPGNDRIKYHNFARTIERRHREGTLVPDVLNAELAKYEALGCDRAVLDEIVRTITGAGA